LAGWAALSQSGAGEVGGHVAQREIAPKLQMAANRAGAITWLRARANSPLQSQKCLDSRQNFCLTGSTEYIQLEPGMSAFSAFILLAAVLRTPATDYVKPVSTPVMKPALIDIPKGPNGLTLYDAKGDVVARCERKDDQFGNCKIEKGYTLDDLMNAWVHAYEDMSK
jgi:hypothetical protein